MAGYSVDLSGLEACQQVIGSQAGQFGGIADTLSQSNPSSDLGALPASGQLAKATKEVSAAARSQMGAARTWLQGAERGLDQVLENYLGAEQFAIYEASVATGTSQQQITIALEQ